MTQGRLNPWNGGQVLTKRCEKLGSAARGQTQTVAGFKVEGEIDFARLNALYVFVFLRSAGATTHR